MKKKTIRLYSSGNGGDRPWFTGGDTTVNSWSCEVGMIISFSQLLSVWPGEGAEARLKIQTNAGGSSTHTHSMGKREGRGAEEKGGPEKEAGGNETRERVTLRVGEGRKLRSTWVWRQACGILGTAQNQNRAGNVGRASGKGDCEEKGSVNSQPWIPAALYGGVCPPFAMLGGGVRVTCSR